MLTTDFVSNIMYFLMVHIDHSHEVDFFDLL